MNIFTTYHSRLFSIDNYKNVIIIIITPVVIIKVTMKIQFFSLSLYFKTVPKSSVELGYKRRKEEMESEGT